MDVKLHPTMYDLHTFSLQVCGILCFGRKRKQYVVATGSRNVSLCSHRGK